MQINIKEFFKEVDKLPTKAKRKFIKLFVGKDRNLVSMCLQLSRSGITEQELLKKWRES